MGSPWRKLPVEPLVAFVEGRGGNRNELLGGQRAAVRRAYYRSVEHGRVTLWTAESIANHFQVHPVEIWGQSYWDVA